MGMASRSKRARLRWLYEAQGGVCAHCGKRVPNPDEFRVKMGDLQDPFGPSLDHVKTVLNGGKNRLENLILAHRKCNERRDQKNLSPHAERMRQMVLTKLRHRREVIG